MFKESHCQMTERPIDIYVEVDDATKPDLAARIVIEFPKSNTTGAAQLYDDLAIAAAVLGEGDEEGEVLETLMAATSVVCKLPGQGKPKSESLMQTTGGRMRVALNAAAALAMGLAAGVQLEEDTPCS